MTGIFSSRGPDVMRYFPMNLDIRGRTAVIVGGGRVAARKCTLLLDAGAVVTVIAPHLASPLADLVRDGRVTHLARAYAEGDLAGACLAFAATSDPAVNRAVADDARAAGILANIADAPDSGSFTVPSSLRRGDLLVTVSTAGRSPALARAIRRQLEPLFGTEHVLALELLGKLREKLLTATGDRTYNDEIFNDLVAHDLPLLFRQGATRDIDNLLLRLFGPGFTLADLGVGERDQQ
jgi:precorrin-2 dehydrogenase